MRKPLTVIIVTLSVVCTLKGMSRWSIQRIKAMLLCIEYGILFVDTVDTKIKACNALNAMFVETVDTTVKTHSHIPAHNFLNIQRIFNPQKVLESSDSGLFNLSINTIYVNTVDTRQGSLMHSMLSMLTLLIQFSHLIVLCIRCCVRVSTVLTNIALNALCALIFISTVSTNKIRYSIHNSIALIFCIDHLDMPSCPLELQCRF